MEHHLTLIDAVTLLILVFGTMSFMALLVIFDRITSGSEDGDEDDEDDDDFDCDLEDSPSPNLKAMRQHSNN